jgi:hypothetical protein
MPRRKHPATTRVPPLVGVKPAFKQMEVAAMLGSTSYQVSRDCSILWPSRPSYSKLNRPEVRTLYCVALFRHLLYSQGRMQVKSSEILSFINNNSEEDIWTLVKMAGGSQEDCDRGIEEMLIQQNQQRLEQETINVQSTVA